jgi:hypothetical protein
MGKTFHPVLTLLLLLHACGAFSQRIEESDTRAMIQANFLYQFAANNNWPSESRKGKFMIGVIGQPSVFDHMSEKYGAKPLGNQVIEIMELIEMPSNASYHIIFIDKSRKTELARAIKDLKGKPTLIVTNWDGALASGSHINFKTVDGNFRYELNQTAMEERKITPGLKILQWKVD